MKKIITAITFAIACISLSAKTIKTNESTGMTLSENAGVYSITGKAGAMIIGDKDATYKLLTGIDKCFAQEKIEQLTDSELSKEYEVHKDDVGMYVVKVGFGAMKIRPSDVNCFLAAMGWKDVKSGLSKAANWLSEKTKKISEDLKD